MVLSNNYEELSASERQDVVTKLKTQAESRTSNTDISNKLQQLKDAESESNSHPMALPNKMAALYTALIKDGVSDADLKPS